MSGNAWEWCWDWYDMDYYAKSKDSQDPKGPESGTYRVLRGGSWYDDAGYCRTANRYDDDPRARDHNYGFRLVFVP